MDIVIMVERAYLRLLADAGRRLRRSERERLEELDRQYAWYVQATGTLWDHLDAGWGDDEQSVDR